MNYSMRITILILLSLSEHIAKAQTNKSDSNIIFSDDFNDNKNNWTVTYDKHASGRIDSGFYYLTATGIAYGVTQEIKINPQKDFKIETRIKILKGEADHKNYYSMIFWGREAMNSLYFTFAKDGFASVEMCDGKHKSGCIIKSGSLQKVIPTADEFNIYTIRKIGNMYSFFINGTQFYQMPFTPFFGNLIGIGAGRKVTLVIDYLKVSYL
ncbi:MAG: hypothetical protein ABI261_05380 [Ginsengibacter sp.]